MHLRQPLQPSTLTVNTRTALRYLYYCSLLLSKHSRTESSPSLRSGLESGRAEFVALVSSQKTDRRSLRPESSSILYTSRWRAVLQQHSNIPRPQGLSVCETPRTGRGPSNRICAISLCSSMSRCAPRMASPSRELACQRLCARRELERHTIAAQLHDPGSRDTRRSTRLPSGHRAASQLLRRTRQL